MQDGSFSDLRNAGDDDQGNFWPVFADLMTVVVMIFLLTMVILVIRNWELVENLQKTLIEKQQATEQALAQAEEKKKLSEEMAVKNDELSLLQMRLMELQEEWEASRTALEKSKLDNESLRTTNEQLTIRLTNTEMQKNQLQEDKKTLDEKLQVQILKHQTLESKLVAQQGEYSELKKKYDKLIRPARTTKGKKIVHVRFDKQNGKTVLTYKPPGESLFKKVSRSQLEISLQKLKVQYPNKLYIKIIFPQGSQVSHREAWKFTNELLSRYDYYYQK